MLQLEWPIVLLALPLPWFVRRFARPARGPVAAALRVPNLDDFSPVAGGTAGASPSRAWWWLAGAAWVLFVIATCRPQWLGEAIEIPVSGRDLILAFDLSRSMEVEDFALHGKTVDRLTASRDVANRFIDRRLGDRLGLILFGTQAYLHVPLTFDRETVKQLLGEAEIGLAGDNTAIGDAIGLAVKRLREQDAKQKVLVLMTDGANTAGEIAPLRAAQLAADAGLTIHTIGIGADEMLVRQLFGTIRVNPSRDLDERTLTGIATATGGRYFRARDTEQLETIYTEIDRLEPVEHAGEHFRPVTPLFYWPLGTALVLALALAWRMQRRRV